MGSTCIITDNSAQFTRPGFSSAGYLRILQHELEYKNRESIALLNMKVSEFPRYISQEFIPIFKPITVDSIKELILSILSEYDDIFIITISKELNPLYQAAEIVSNSLHGHATIHLIDSQNVSIGLGLIVQYASELCKKNLPADEIEKLIRLAIPHVYTLICTPNLSFLENSGILDKGQSVIGEMMCLFPIFVLEEGRLNPLLKVKNQRNAVEYFCEFIDEYDSLANVSLIQPVSPSISETKSLHQHLDECFTEVTYSEHTINPFLASMIGPRGFGMVVMEKP